MAKFSFAKPGKPRAIPQKKDSAIRSRTVVPAPPGPAVIDAPQEAISPPTQQVQDIADVDPPLGVYPAPLQDHPNELDPHPRELGIDERLAPYKKTAEQVAAILTKEQWEKVVHAFAETGDPRRMARLTKIPGNYIRQLLTEGIPRLGLPPIREYTIDQAQLHIDSKAVAEVARKKEEMVVARQAVQERVTQEAGCARALLEQTIAGSQIASQYVQKLMANLASEQCKLMMSPIVTLDTIEKLAKVLETNSRAVDRAVKLVRLTQGEPTETVDVRLGLLLASCTIEEVLDAERTGKLPARLLSRGESADPVDNGKTDFIDADYEVGDPDAGAPINVTSLPRGEVLKDATWIDELVTDGAEVAEAVVANPAEEI